MRVTMKQIAESLGLDKSTVSLALSASPRVAAETRERVVAAARSMGYRPNLAARQLKAGSPQLISLVLPAMFPTLASAAAASAMSALSSQAARAGMVFNVVTASSLVAAAEGDLVYPHVPDGLLVWGDVPLQRVQAMSPLGIPTVVLDPNHPSYHTYDGPMVGIDNRAGSAAMVQHLLDRGAEHLLFVGVVADHIGHEHRWKAARAAWLEHRPVSTVSYCTLDELSDEQLTSFAANPGAAVFCSNDVGALQVWHRACEAGLAVPADLSVAGFDGEAHGRALGLTSVLFDGDALGEQAFVALRQTMDDVSSVVRTAVPATLLAGRST